GAEGPAVVPGQPLDVAAADVEQGQQRQGDGAPVGVGGQPGQGDPDVAVQEGRPGRPGGGVVVDAGALDVGAVAPGRGVVQAEQQASAAPEVGHQDAEEQQAAEFVGLP